MAKDGEDYGLRAILYERGSLKLLDQRVIPYEVSPSSNTSLYLSLLQH